MGKASPAESDVHATTSVNNPPILNGPGRSKVMLPLSNDGNAPVARGPYQNTRGAGPPYRRGI
jgi:hypothetical protein